MDYFQTDYEAARKQFLDLTEKIREIYPDTKLESIENPPGNKEGLYTDVFYFPQENSNKLAIISSGIHGIEAYTGSAVQQMILNEFILPGKKPPFSLLFIHSINPFGQKYFRRVNENNVDLNRNFVPDPSFFFIKGGANPAYEKFHSFLNPGTKASAGNFTKLKFNAKAFTILLRYGVKAFRQAVLQGQYQYPDGIFFGGNNYEFQQKLILGVINQFWKPFKEIILIDIHTGYGYRGELHLIGMDRYDNPKIFEKLKKLYPGFQIEKADKDQGDFYKIHGSFFEYFYNLAKQQNKNLYPVAWEFGTNDNIKTLKSLESLRIVSAENQAFHHGCKSKKDQAKIQKDFRELFYPASRDWQNRVMELGRKAFSSVFSNGNEI